MFSQLKGTKSSVKKDKIHRLMFSLYKGTKSAVKRDNNHNKVFTGKRDEIRI